MFDEITRASEDAEGGASVGITGASAEPGELATEFSAIPPALDVVGSDVESPDTAALDVMARFKDTAQGQMLARISRLPNFDEDSRNDLTCQKQFVGNIAVTDDLEDIIKTRYGPGAYRIEFRRAGVGKIEQVSLFEVAPDDSVDDVEEISTAVATIPSELQTVRAEMTQYKGVLGLMAELEKMRTPQKTFQEQLTELGGAFGVLRQMGIIPNEETEKKEPVTGSSWPDIVRELIGAIREGVAVYIAANASNARAQVSALPVYQAPVVAPVVAPVPSPVVAPAPAAVAAENGAGGLDTFEAVAALAGKLQTDLINAALANVPVEDFAAGVHAMANADPGIQSILSQILSVPSDMLVAQLPLTTEADRLTVSSYLQRVQSVYVSEYASDESAFTN